MTAAVDSVVRKVTWRIVPLMFLGSMLANVDKANVGMASLQMNRAVNLSPSVYGFGVGAFFIVYALCEVPSNVALGRFGARVWMTRIMLTWGVISMAGALIVGPRSFLLNRVMLGAAEAGFLPGAIAFMAGWLPAAYRARTLSYFMVAIPLAAIISSPISAALLRLDGMGGLQGWQWLFIIEGLPTLFLAGAMWRLLRDTPTEAKWLTPAERETLADALADDVPAGHLRLAAMDVLRAMAKPVVLLFTLVLGCLGGVTLAVQFWLPQILRGAGLTSTETGFAATLPALVGIVALLLWSRHSDCTGEKRWHLAIPAMIAGASLAMSAAVPVFPVRFALLVLAIASVMSMQGIFWAAVSTTLAGKERIVGVAAINAGGTLIAFLEPYLIGVVKQATGTFDLAFVMLGLFGILGGLLSIALFREMTPRGARARSTAAADQAAKTVLEG